MVDRVFVEEGGREGERKEESERVAGGIEEGRGRGRDYRFLEIIR